MAQVYLSIGSNIDREKNIKSCLSILKQDYPDIIFSSIYETQAFGFKGDPFLNLAAYLQTELSPQAMESYVKSIEDKHARTREGKKFSSRTLDIDLLLYDQLILQPEMDIPRKEITRYDFVLIPLLEIAPNAIHPIAKKTIAELAKGSKLAKGSDLAKGSKLSKTNLKKIEL